MVRCPRCGESNAEEAVYCRRCGAVLRGRDTGLDKLTRDFDAQRLWLLRLAAYVVDVAVVAVVGLLLALLAYVPLAVGSVFSGQWSWRGVWQVPLLIGAGQVMYFSVMESFYGASFGKQLMGLRVEAGSGGRPTLVSALVRNISKVHGALLLLDVLLGLLLGDDPRDRFTDTLAKTYVVRGGSPAIPNLGDGKVFTSEPRSGHVVVMGDWGRGVDPLDSAGFGVFLVVAASITLNFPDLAVTLVEWIRGWGVSGVSWPPSELVTPVYWFLMAMGSWSIISAAIRYLMNWKPYRAPQDVVGGAFNFLLAYMVQYYGFSFFSWRIVVPLFIVFVGAQMLVSSLVRPRRG